METLQEEKVRVTSEILRALPEPWKGKMRRQGLGKAGKWMFPPGDAGQLGG